MKSKEFSDKSIKPSPASNNNLAPGFNYNTRARAKFNGTCLKQDKVTFTHKQVPNIYIVYVIDLWPFIVGKDFVFYLELLS